MDSYNPKYNPTRAPGHEHIPLYPKGFIALRIVQLILALICVGLCGFGVAVLAFAGDTLMLFTVSTLPATPTTTLRATG